MTSFFPDLCLLVPFYVVFFSDYTGRFVSDMVRNHEGRFSHGAAQIAQKMHIYVFNPQAYVVDRNIFGKQTFASLYTYTCAPLVADLFLNCYERDFMDSLNNDNEADVIEAFNSTSRYLDDILNIDNPYFEGMVKQIYPPEL